MYACERLKRDSRGLSRFARRREKRRTIEVTAEDDSRGPIVAGAMRLRLERVRERLDPTGPFFVSREREREREEGLRTRLARYESIANTDARLRRQTQREVTRNKLRPYVALPASLLLPPFGIPCPALRMWCGARRVKRGASVYFRFTDYSTPDLSHPITESYFKGRDRYFLF